MVSAWLPTTHADFNPRSREGSDEHRLASCPGKPISIHAPAKGATQMEQVVDTDLNISIHAPAKGATNNYLKYTFQNRFQSTLPRRERQQLS